MVIFIRISHVALQMLAGSALISGFVEGEKKKKKKKSPENSYLQTVLIAAAAAAFSRKERQKNLRTPCELVSTRSQVLVRRRCP